MTQVYRDPYTGQEHEFPDDATPQEIDAATGQLSSGEGLSRQQQAIQDIMSATGNNRSLFDTGRDVLQGSLTGLGKGGQAIAGLLTGGRAPSVDMDEMFSSIGSPKKSSGGNIAKGIGEYLPYGIAGGARMLPSLAMGIPGQFAAGTAAGASLTEPDEENLFGFLPKGRLGGAIEGFSLAGLPSAISRTIGSVKGATKSGLKNLVIGKHDAIDSAASRKFDNVSSGVKERNISNFPSHQGLSADLSEYFPRTRAAKKLLSRAESGDYDSLRKVQSDLYTRGKDNLDSDLEADRLRGDEMLEKRDDINSMISSHLRKTGNEDLASTLDSARMDWRKLQEIYYNPKMNRAIIKMVDKRHRLIPKNIENVLSEESLPMQQLRDFHPGLDDAISRHLKLKGVAGKIRDYVLPAGIGGIVGGYAATRYMNR